MYISQTGIDANVRAIHTCAHICAHACAQVNTARTNGGEEVRMVIALLSEEYVVYKQILAMAGYGDCCHRKRLVLVAFAKISVGHTNGKCLQLNTECGNHTVQA